MAHHAKKLSGLATMTGALALSACMAPMPVAQTGGYSPNQAATGGYAYGYGAEAVDEYAWIDRADSLSEALGDAPPDYGFAFDGGEPVAWMTADGYWIVADQQDDGLHVYYFAPGDTAPFFVRDPERSFAYEDGAVVVVYRGDGWAMTRGDGSAYVDLAMRRYDRGRALRRAIENRTRDRQWSAVPVNLWLDLSVFWFDAQRQWDYGRTSNPGWRRHRDRADAIERRRRWSGERERRRVDSERFRRWREGEYRGTPPGRYTPPAPGSGRPNPGSGRPGRPGGPGGPGAGRPPMPPAPPAPTTSTPAPPAPPVATRPYRQPVTGPAREPGPVFTAAPEEVEAPEGRRPGPRPRVSDPGSQPDVATPSRERPRRAAPPPAPAPVAAPAPAPSPAASQPAYAPTPARPDRPIRERYRAAPPPAYTPVPPAVTAPTPPPARRPAYTPPAPAYTPPPARRPAYTPPPPPAPAYVAPPPPPAPVYVAPPPPPPAPSYSPPPPPRPAPPPPPRRLDPDSSNERPD